MREIKFRAWNPRKKEMFHPATISENSQIEHKMGFGGFELMQYTGLNDKNGVEIYEGDIYKDKRGIAHIVTFQLGAFCGGVNPCMSAPLGYSASGEYIDIDPDPDFSMAIELIGNIHQNPELLKMRLSL